MKKIKIITFFTLIMILCMCQVSNAFSVRDLVGTKITNSTAENLGNKIITVASTIGSILSVIVLIIIGLKYMFGSVEEKAEYKKSLMPYLIGSVIVFTASTLVGVIYQIAP